ncbi:MAG: sigma-70 family RNA polymerase sigma factor [Candidatus Latescibacterota bacterium]|nr:MAG: sigma-70 family RNA polymerase sigma factor [Candidatus Latescibacterota bacterium]
MIDERKSVHADSLREKSKLKTLSDEELILRVPEGDNVSFDILVDRYKVRLYNYLFRLVRDEDEAEELAQETFVKAFIHAGKYKTIAKFSTWLYTIATNLVRNRLRAKKRAPRFLSLWSRGSESEDEGKTIDLVDQSRLPDARFNDSELGEIINEAIGRIPEKYRVSFVLREVNQLSYEEIAAATGLKLGTVRSRINRARNYFRKLLEPVLERGTDF